LDLRLLGCAATISLYIGGCGTIFNGSTEEILFVSYPPGASVSFINAPGVPTVQTPATLELKRDKSYTARFELAGYPDHDVMIHSGPSGWLVGNIVFGGIIGLVVDFISGGAYNLYPDELYIDMATGTIGDVPEVEDSDDN